ncbi:hypothetical protein P3X46_015564 [Hevea brasiliensis]|uniref:Uncharacterized protein n=1 Tax=Hevea brasiliensis TaxID=3981 RepID=A0ABQ9LZM6_HEVBR|nr:hypothetical protein P3X46_015564 [Hevea brasiliensis]
MVILLSKLFASLFAPNKAASGCLNMPKGFLAPSFQDLLRKAEKEFGLTILCREDPFLHVTSSLSRA